MSGPIAASGGHQPPDVDPFIDLMADLDGAVSRLRRLTFGERRHHPSTPAALRVAIDDIADTAARLNELLP